MAEYTPLLIVGAIIGVFTVLFTILYVWDSRKKETRDFERHMSDAEIVRRLLVYAKPYWKEFLLVFVVMLFSIAYDLVSPLLIGDIQTKLLFAFRKSNPQLSPGRKLSVVGEDFLHFSAGVPAAKGIFVAVVHFSSVLSYLIVLILRIKRRAENPDSDTRESEAPEKRRKTCGEKDFQCIRQKKGQNAFQQHSPNANRSGL